MSIMKQRLPLGEFSSSKINKLAIANIADASEARGRGENSVGAVCLPSIKSLMVSPEVYENAKSPARSLDERRWWRYVVPW